MGARKSCCLPSERPTEEVVSLPVSAFWSAAVRAQENKRLGAAVVKDEYAEALMNDSGWGYYREYVDKWGKFQSSGLSPEEHVRCTVLRRTVFVDGKCCEAAAAGVRQCVVLGAAFDTRAFRLFQGLPDMHVFEVDHPGVFDYKEDRLTKCRPPAVPLCKRSTVVLPDGDISGWSTASQQAGFDPSAPAMFVLECLTQYLTEAQETCLYSSIVSASAPGSVLVGDTMVTQTVRYRTGIQDIVWYRTDREKMKAAFVEGGYADFSWTNIESDELNFPGGPCFRPPAWGSSLFLHSGTKTA